MPIQHDIDHQRRWVEAHAEGEVTLDDIETFLDAVIVADALPYRKVFEGRLAFGKYTDEDLMRLAARLSAYASLGRRGPAAIVPSHDYYELAVRFVNLDKSDHTVRVFLDLDEARAWLATQPEVL